MAAAAWKKKGGNTVVTFNGSRMKQSFDGDVDLFVPDGA